MIEHDDLERRLARWFEAEAVGPALPGRRHEAIEATGKQRPRPAALARYGSGWVDPWPLAASPHIPWSTFAVVGLLILALAAAAIYVGGQPRPRPSVVGPAGNGLIAYGSEGDIYVGDPVTGRTWGIVTGPEADSGPIFSPDGTRIAFLRGDAWSEDASIVVVRADGSDERVAMPAGFSERGVGIAWTPGSATLVANVDAAPLTTPYFDGELALLDASGLAEPRLLTPPLPRGPGGPYFRYTDQIAPMFRPPSGDLIVSGTGAGIYIWDADLENRTELAVAGLDSYPNHYFQPWAFWWSPDGSMIAFELGWGDREPFEIGTFVMHADGTAVRPLEGVEGGVAWSPDGSKIAYQRGCPDPDRQGAVVVIADVASGAERVLETTVVETKYEGDVSPVPPGEVSGCFGGWIQGPAGRAWDYEGWSWSPDGQSIVTLERSGTNPVVVDVESGQATELPWEADSPPSWQRIPGDSG